MLKYLALLLLPSTPVQWLLLILMGVAGWFIFALYLGNSWKSLEAYNIFGVICGIALFYGIKNGLGGLGDMFSSLTGKYVNGYPHPVTTLANAFLAIPRIVVGYFFIIVAKEFAEPLAEKEEENNKAIAQQQEKEKAEREFNQSVGQIAAVFNLLPEAPGLPNYHGYKLVNEDNGGSPDLLWHTVNPQNIQLAKTQSRLYGNPGGGLSQSNFTANEIQSGQKGEQVLASMIAANCPNVVSFWSLYGLNEQRGFTNADIDCVIVGQDMQGVTHLWFVDAKNYKGNADTAYRNRTENQLLRICISQRAFENGVDGRPDLKLSANMDWQRNMWAFMFLNKPVEVEWLVCMVPTSDKGVPDVNGVTWPGNIPCVTPEELVGRVNAVGLDSVQNIPLDWLDTFKKHLKR